MTYGKSVMLEDVMKDLGTSLIMQYTIQVNQVKYVLKLILVLNLKGSQYNMCKSGFNLTKFIPTARNYCNQFRTTKATENK